jgi:hypothetical protein
MAHGAGLGLTLEVQDDPVPEHGKRDRLDVVDAHGEPAGAEREHLAPQDQRLRRTGARPVANVAPRDVRSLLPLRMGGHHQRRRELPDV